MDTKSRSNKIIGIIASLLVIGLIAAALLALGGKSYAQIDTRMSTHEEASSFVQRLYEYSYAQYWKQQQHWRGDVSLTPADLYFPEARDMILQSGMYSEDDNYAVDNFSSNLLGMMAGWESEFSHQWGGMEYYVLDENTGYGGGAGDEGLKQLVRNALQGDAAERMYRFYVVIRFDENGKMTLVAQHGIAQNTVYDALQGYNPDENFVSYLGYQNLEEQLLASMHRPRNVSFVYAMPMNAPPAVYQQYYSNVLALRAGGMELAGLAAMALVVLLGFLLLRVKSLGLSSSALSRFPLEIAVLLPFLAWAVYYGGMEAVLAHYDGSIANHLASMGLSLSYARPLSAFVTWAILALSLAIAYVGGMSLGQVQLLGIKRYLLEKSWCVRIVRWLGRGCKKLYAWVTSVDLSDKSTKTIFKLVAVNFVILAVICAMWVFGWFPLIAYSIILFFLLKKRLDDLKSKHDILLGAAGELAKGNLQVQIDEDLGVFEPLKAELMAVKDGFGEAVEAEVRSQNMKTELISNVSHDLKTPLTAIITYTDLLKDESISPEQRREYVRTLESKTQRLKRLIDDLFEASKASSNNLPMDPQTLDVTALLRQVQSELADDFEAAGIELRTSLPAGPVMVCVDGEKTSRIFENLLCNACKYSFEHSRVYVAVEEKDGMARISVKNVSKEPMEFDGEMITERFVRGDRSRNTEGSGLGLAIAKSLAENQGGRLIVEVDGDLFTATVEFPLHQNAADVSQQVV